jgi:hypothetical protein
VLEHFTEHDIRAKNASDKANEAKAQQQLGHATVMVVQRVAPLTRPAAK